MNDARDGDECYNCLRVIPDDERAFVMTDPDDMYATVQICATCDSEIKETAADPQNRDQPMVSAWLESQEN